MALLTEGALVLLLGSMVALTHAAGAGGAIDRQALVTRHDIRWDIMDGPIPLGNGEFCFSVDGTGLQTSCGNTLSHWAWHSAPLPAGVTPADVPRTGTIERGRVTGPMRRASGRSDLDTWMFQNPHPMNLGRLRFVGPDESAIAIDGIARISRTHHLWTGLCTSSFEVNGRPVLVETCVHPTMDLVAVRLRSPLLSTGALQVALDFPYPTVANRAEGAGDWDRPTAHLTEIARDARMGRAEISRRADAASYRVAVGWSEGGSFARSTRKDPGAVHRFVLSGGRDGVLEFVCAFERRRPRSLPTVTSTRQAAAAHWQRFWKTGGAIDLSHSADPRWRELERRIVLSQYQMAVQSAGSWPPSEAGLMAIDPWNGQFHMEMIWWHLAHYGLWDRWKAAVKALDCYRTFLPTARSLAAQFGYRGARWGKQVGPEGRTAPWQGSFVLHWQQPHPMFLAELDYRLRPTRSTLQRWRDIVFATADYMAAFPSEADGAYHLAPIMPPSEQGVTRDTVFDLAYWRWGLDAAQRWRQRLGLGPEPRWDDVRRNLAPLPEVGGVYVHSAEWTDTYSKRAWEHPDPVGVYGMLPPIDGVDRDTAHRTLLKVWETWDWRRCWGWDFPWTAMAAARLGEPQLAVEALLKDAGDRNAYDARGVNSGGPCPYLPGNGGLLYAVAMMAAGWDGAPQRHAPGFPDDGTWVVRWEGLKPAP